MAEVAMFNMEGEEVGKLELNDALFGVEVNEHLLHMAVVHHLAVKRRGTQKAKTRAEVSGGGKKPWRQKGTGHARQGSIRAPQWKGGGVVFAPVPRDYSFKMNKKEKRAALCSALSDKVNEGRFIVLESLELEEYKTKAVKGVLDKLKAEGKSYLVTTGDQEKVVVSARNLPEVKTADAGSLCTYDILNAKYMVITKDAVKKIEEVFA